MKIRYVSPNGQWQIRSRGAHTIWPFAIFDVYGKTPHSWDRLAGGWWTKHGALKWIETEQASIDRARP